MRHTSGRRVTAWWSGSRWATGWSGMARGSRAICHGRDDRDGLRHAFGPRRGTPDRDAPRLRRSRPPRRGVESARDRVRSPRDGRQCRAMRAGAGDSRRLWSSVRRVGRPGDPPGRHPRLATSRHARTGPLQRRDHGRIGKARADGCLEDVALRVRADEAQGGRRRARRPRATGATATDPRPADGPPDRCQRSLARRRGSRSVPAAPSVRANGAGAARAARRGRCPGRPAPQAPRAGHA